MRCRAATASILCAQQVVAVASSMRYIMDTELVTAVYQTELKPKNKQMLTNVNKSYQKRRNIAKL